MAWEPLARQAREAVDRLLEEQGRQARVIVEEGEAAKVAQECIRREKAQLLVIARGSAAEAGRLRTNAYAMIRSSPCPVVSV